MGNGIIMQHLYYALAEGTESSSIIVAIISAAAIF